MLRMARFLRWVGSKEDQLELLLSRLPRPLPRRYVEPFVGAGALFFELRARGLLLFASKGTPTVVLSDGNERLIRCYRAVQKWPAKVADRVKRLPVDRATYNAVRSWQVDAGTDVDVAAWLIYVNHAGYSGLFRFSKKGTFNVPFDASRAGKPWQGRERLQSAAMALRGVELVHGDFGVVLTKYARANTFAYFDPPYFTKAAEFVSYTAGGFDKSAHLRLVRSAQECRSKGVHVLASNSALAAPFWNQAGFRVELHDGGRLIGRGKKSDQVRAPELLASSY